MRILITGHNGYIGSVMGPYLAERGHQVVGLDTDYFAECTLVAPATLPGMRKDLRDVTARDLAGFDAIVHLAALSNDPIGNLNDDWTADINFRASVRLAELARSAGVQRFLFSSSCIMYGLSEAAEATEESPLDPQTEYARSKVRTELALRELAADGFSPVYLRNGTVYGLSPRMRFDTVLNDLVGQALTSGRIEIFSDGTPWRPTVHVLDVARAFEAVLDAPREQIHNQAFNTGADALNRQVIDLARLVAEAVPGTELVVRAIPSADQRTYRASFAKFARTFPDFAFLFDPPAGARRLVDDLAGIGLTADQFASPRYIRLRWLRQLLADGALDGNLRWAQTVGEAA